VAESHCATKQLQRERAALEEKISRTLAYMSPIRRLPAELLRHIFMMNFDEYPCCAWILSSVCSQWRRLTLSMPKLWSKVWYLSQYAFPPWFLSWELYGPSLGIFRTSPLISQLFYRVIACLSVSPPHRSHSHPIMVEIHLPPGQLCAPLFVHRPAISWLLGHRLRAQNTVLDRLSGRLWTQSSCLFRYAFSPDAVIARP
jgi:hypothetical protein